MCLGAVEIATEISKVVCKRIIMEYEVKARLGKHDISGYHSLLLLFPLSNVFAYVL